MNYHIEHAKYNYSQITVTGWLTGDTAGADTSVSVEDSARCRCPCKTRRSEREDVREALFPDETQCLFGFHVKFPVKACETYYLCLSDGRRTVRRRISLQQISSLGRISDNARDELRIRFSGTASAGKGEAFRGSIQYPEGQRNNLYAEADSIWNHPDEINAFAASSTVKFSIIVPVFNTNREHLADMLASVLRQTYTDWELCLADAGTVPIVRSPAGNDDEYSAVIDEALKDPRVRYCRLPVNGGISANSNAALEMASGEYTVMLDHDDVLTDDALSCCAALLALHPETDFFYSDSDLTDNDFMYVYNPLYKPDWSPESLCCANYITHLSAVRTQLLRDLRGWRSEYDGAQDWDLFLRIGEKSDHIRHIPLVLYHWRAAEESTASDVMVKPYARSAQLRAVQDHLTRIGVRGRTEFSDPARTCIRVILGCESAGTYVSAENADIKAAGADEGCGPDTESAILWCAEGVHIDDEGSRELKRWACVPGIGIAAPRLQDADGRILSQGLLAKEDGPVDLLSGQTPGTADTLGHTDWYRNPDAVEPVCFAISVNALRSSGCRVEDLADGDLGILDLCLRLRSSGYRCMVDPFVSVTVPDTKAGSQKSGESGAAASLMITQRIISDEYSRYHDLLRTYRPEERG